MKWPGRPPAAGLGREHLARSARAPLLELDALEARRVGAAGNATALRDRPPVDLLDVAREVDGRRAADVRAHGVGIDRRAGLLEHPDALRVEAARDDDLHVAETRLVQPGAELVD